MFRKLDGYAVSAGLLFALVAGCSAAAGDTGSSGAPTLVIDQAVTRAPVGVGAHGPIKRVGEALGQVDLRPDQRASLEALATDAVARQGVTERARADLTQAIASFVERGAIDRAALAPQIDALGRTLRDEQRADRTALEAVHGILDPAQRVAFVEALRASFHGPHGRDHEGHEASGPLGAQRWHSLDQWKTDLGLSDTQVLAVTVALAPLHPDHADDADEGHAFHGPLGRPDFIHGRELLDAFTKDDFHADDIDPNSDPAAGVLKMTTHVLDLADKVLPILTPEQRQIAAKKLRERAVASP